MAFRIRAQPSTYAADIGARVVLRTAGSLGEKVELFEHRVDAGRAL